MPLVCMYIFSLLLSDNCAATTAAFPPNGRGQINLPLLMSANGSGPFLPPPPSTCRSEHEPRRACLMTDLVCRSSGGGGKRSGERVLLDPDHNCWFRFKYSGQKALDIDPDVHPRD